MACSVLLLWNLPCLYDMIVNQTNAFNLLQNKCNCYLYNGAYKNAWFVKYNWRISLENCQITGSIRNTMNTIMSKILARWNRVVLQGILSFAGLPTTATSMSDNHPQPVQLGMTSSIQTVLFNESQLIQDNVLIDGKYGFIDVSGTRFHPDCRPLAHALEQLKTENVTSEKYDGINPTKSTYMLKNQPPMYEYFTFHGIYVSTILWCKSSFVWSNIYSGMRSDQRWACVMFSVTNGIISRFGSCIEFRPTLILLLWLYIWYLTLTISLLIIIHDFQVCVE